MARVGVLSALAWVLAACATTGDVEALQLRVADLELDRERVKASLAEDVKRLENLHGMLTTAEETLRKHGANLGLRMEHLEQDLPKVDGKADVLEFRLKAIDRLLDLIKEEVSEKLQSMRLYLPLDLPSDADGMWKTAAAKQDAGDQLVARAIYELFEATYSSDPRADDALMAIAALLEQEGDVKGAMKRYSKVERYPEGDQVGKAVLRIGELLDQQGQCKRAKGVYEYLAKQYPKVAEAPEAAKRAKGMGKSCK
jgi:TolA-binding protein